MSEDETIESAEWAPYRGRSWLRVEWRNGRIARIDRSCVAYGENNEALVLEGAALRIGGRLYTTELLIRLARTVSSIVRPAPGRQLVPCPPCEASGRLGDATCMACNGEGVVEWDRTQAVAVALSPSDSLRRAFARRDALLKRGEFLEANGKAKDEVFIAARAVATEPESTGTRWGKVFEEAHGAMLEDMLKRIGELTVEPAERDLMCPTCRRVFCRIRVAPAAFVEVVCPGCALEGRAE